MSIAESAAEAASRNEMVKFERKLDGIKMKIMLYVWISAVMAAVIISMGLYFLLMMLIGLAILPWPESIAILSIPMVIIAILAITSRITALLGEVRSLKVSSSKSK